MWPAAALVLFLAFQSNYYEQGMKALDEKRYEAAVENFRNAIAAAFVGLDWTRAPLWVLAL